jgi:hypothetical protein
MLGRLRNHGHVLIAHLAAGEGSLRLRQAVQLPGDFHPLGGRST